MNTSFFIVPALKSAGLHYLEQVKSTWKLGSAIA
jgi:hypothetical protein